jgi:uncharacterized protein
MLLDLRQFRGGHDHVVRALEAEALDAAGDEFRVVAPVRLDFDVDRDGTSFHLRGIVASALELTCSRCLEWYRWPVEVAFDLLYLPQEANTGEGEVEVQDEDLHTAFYRDESIDLVQLAREQFYLAMPMKPLCADSCRGLCSVCGTNLNLATCRCRRDWDDPRLDGLRTWAGGGDEPGPQG